MAELDTSRYAAVGERVAEARRSAGLTQGALADRLEMSLSQIERIELGRSDPSEHLDRLAEATGRSAQWLVTGSDSADSQEDVVTALGSRIQDREKDTDLPEAPGDDEAASVVESLEPQDELDRLFVSLAGQRDELKRRHSELDRREQELEERHAGLEERDRVLHYARAEFEREWEQQLKQLEALHKSVVESAHAFASRAAELRRTIGGSASTAKEEQKPG